MEKRLIRNDVMARREMGEFKNTTSHFIDKQGNRLIGIVQDDYMFGPVSNLPSDTKQFIEDIKALPCKDDDIFLVSYPKSGMHWMGNLVSMLVRGNTKYTGTPYFIDTNDLVPIGKMKEPRIIASHLRLDQLPQQLLRGRGRIINISRNPKDCAVSHFTFLQKLSSSRYDGDFHSFLDYFYRGIIHYGKWFDHVKGFATSDNNYPSANILTLRYEDMKMNFRDSILKITEFLNISCEADFIRKVEKRCSFQNMQRDVAAETGEDERWPEAKGNILPIYTKGKIGEWKNWLTVSENEEFDTVIERELYGTGIHYRFEV